MFIIVLRSFKCLLKVIISKRNWGGGNRKKYKRLKSSLLFSFKGQGPRTEIIYIGIYNWSNHSNLFFSDTMDLTDDEAHLPRPAGTPGSHALYSLDRCSSLNKFEVPSSNGSSSGETSSSNKDSSGVTPTCTSATPTLATPTFFVTSCQSSDMDGGSHSSEEELEEINNLPNLPNSNSTSSSMSTPLPNESTATPVEFSTTPPNHVHKPRRSTSPPPCIPLVHEVATTLPPRPSSNDCGTGGGSGGTDHASPDAGHAPSGEAGHAPSSLELRSHDGNSIDRRNILVVERRTIASKKRYKQSRIHHIQRPCLDFEKMQLVS